MNSALHLSLMKPPNILMNQFLRIDKNFTKTAFGLYLCLGIKTPERSLQWSNKLKPLKRLEN